MQLVLSACTGAGLLDTAFKQEGFCVVSAGDIIYNIDGDIRNFKSVPNKFNGVIAGTRCQDFSKKNRKEIDKLNCYSFDMLQEFKRVVLESDCDWALLENVAETPDLHIEDYSYQRIDINQSWYEPVNRLRHIQFYSKNGLYLHFDRVTDPGKKQKCDSAALASDNRTFKELLKLQGLPQTIDFPDFSVRGKKKLIGNGVPLSIGRVLARSVKSVIDQSQKSDYTSIKRCECDCKRIVTHRGKYYDASCRKRAQRQRDKMISQSQG